MTEILWNLCVTDKGKGVSPRFVVRAVCKSTAIVVYGTGDNELQARQDAYQQMEAVTKRLQA